ncbi:MAG TPA: hypothetical protein VNA30_05475 [Mycobacteriales bacterium]|nr:hypothetical protein [Mycobacteriales bacterium]
MSRGSRYAALVCCAALGLLGVAPPATADRATSSAPCQVIGFSPTFADDGTAFCAHQSFSSGDFFPTTPGRTGPVRLFTTTDYGRTWRSVAAAGLPGAATGRSWPTLTQIVFSAAYAFDRAIFLWAAEDGLFRSTDAGRTWTEAAVSPVGRGRLTPLLLSAGDEAGGPAVGALLYAAPWGVCFYGNTTPGTQNPQNALVIWPAAVPLSAPGCSRSEQYLVPRDWPTSPAHLLSTSYPPNSSGRFDDGEAEIWSCQPPVHCGDRGVLRAKSDVVEGWLDERARGVIRAHVRESKGNRARLVVSRDAGKSWQPWGSADAALVRESYTVKLADGGDRQTFALRASGSVNSSTELRYVGQKNDQPRAERIYRTTNDGRSWTLLAAAPAKAGVPLLPFNAPYGLAQDRGGLWQQGNRLFTLAESDVGSSEIKDAGVWCSLDGGRRWTPRCPR